MAPWARFKTERHRTVFEELMRLAGAHPDNQEWSAALYVLAATGKDPKAIAQYFVKGFEGIDWAGLKDYAGPWSRGERRLVDLAAALHSREAQHRISMYDLGDLDPQNFEVAVIGIRRLSGRSSGDITSLFY